KILCEVQIEFGGQGTVIRVIAGIELRDTYRALLSRGELGKRRAEGAMVVVAEPVVVGLARKVRVLGTGSGWCGCNPIARSRVIGFGGPYLLEVGFDEIDLPGDAEP